MNIRKILFSSFLVFGLCGACWLPRLHAGAGADAPAPNVAPAGPPVPAIVQKGFTMWAKNRDASWAFDVWKLGGFLERDNKPNTLARYFARLDANVGPFKNYEVISTKGISANSAIVYMSINFDHAAIYGRFMLYRTDKDWVVQDMDFSPKPEAMMPWLAFEGNTYDQ